MSPEQARAKTLDRRSDVFSLGVCAWELITGERLFHRKHELDMLRAVQMCDVPALSTVRGDVPAALEAALARALAPEPERRWSTAAELGAAIGGWMAAAGVAPSKARLARTMAQLFGEDAAQKRLGVVDRDAVEVTAPNLQAAPPASHDADDVTPPQKDARVAIAEPRQRPRRSTQLDSAGSWPAIPEVDEAHAATLPRLQPLGPSGAAGGASAPADAASPARGWIPQIKMHLHLPPPRLPPLRLLMPMLGFLVSAGGLLFGLHSPHTRRALSAPALALPGVGGNGATAGTVTSPIMVPRALKLTSTPLKLAEPDESASLVPMVPPSPPLRVTRPTPAVSKAPGKRHVRRPRRARGGKV
jgi:hypothetical protein